ncbi:MAG: DUF2892 domain-containing protein [Chloroflexota bacterium]
MSFLNESNKDRIVRVVLGIAILALSWSGMVSGTVDIILKVIGIISLLTGLVGFCPLYAILKIRTKKA